MQDPGPESEPAGKCDLENHQGEKEEDEEEVETEGEDDGDGDAHGSSQLSSCHGGEVMSQLDGQGVCEVCGEGEIDDDELVTCQGGYGCKVCVHKSCYGTKGPPRGPWLCEACEVQKGEVSRLRMPSFV